MEIVYRHSFDREEAKARIRALGEYLENRHGIRAQWSDNSARFSGKYMVVTIDGELTVGDDKVEFRGKDPGMLWRKKAKGYLQGKLETYLDPDTALADLPRGT